MMHSLARSISFPVMALLFVPALASAGVEPEGPDEELAPGDYYRADPLPVTPEQLSAEPPPPSEAASGTLFINFDGATLKAGNDNAPTNTTQMPSQYVQFNYPAYGQGAKRDATLQAVKSDWAPFNVEVTDVRPAQGPYHMCMTGPGKGGGLPNGVLGIAPLDCNDGQKSNVVYAFHSVNDQFGASTQATTISQELAHAFGLEHVNQPADIMNPFNAGGDPAFLDQCIGIDGGGNGIVCGSQHAQYCGNGSNQNSYKELVGFFGASSPDVGPPTVAITYPGPGDVFSEGASFEVTVDASDDKGVTKVNLYANGGSVGTDTTAPYAWPVSMIPAGEYDFQAVAFDAANNQTMSAVVHVSVQSMNGSTSGTTTTTGGSASASDSASASGTSDSGTGTGGDPTTSGGDADGSSGDVDTGSDDATATAGSALPPGYGDGLNEGGCRIGGREAIGGLALLLPVLWRRRRRG